jgi:hypothetical protein
MKECAVRYKTPLQSLKSAARAQELDIEDCAISSALYLDLRATEIVSVATGKNLGDYAITYSGSMTSTDLDGNVISTTPMKGSSTRHIFSGLVELINPVVVDSGIEYARFKIIEVGLALPDLPSGKVGFAHADQNRHTASMNVRAPRGAVSLHFGSHASRLTYVLQCPTDTVPSKSRGEIPPQGAGNEPKAIQHCVGKAIVNGTGAPGTARQWH